MEIKLDKPTFALVLIIISLVTAIVEQRYEMQVLMDSVIDNVRNITELYDRIAQLQIQLDLVNESVPELKSDLDGPWITEKPCRFLVGTVDVGHIEYTYGLNGTTGELWNYCANDSDMLGNWVLGNLSSGRTWIEKVIFIGDFTVDNTLEYPSFVDIEILGKISLADNSDCPIFTNRNHTYGNEMVYIHSGYLRGNKDNNAWGSHGIELVCNGPNPHDSINAEEIWIYNMVIEDIHGSCIFINMTGSGTRHLHIHDITGWSGFKGTGTEYGCGLFAQGLFDSHIYDCRWSGQTRDVYLVAPISCHFEDFYCAYKGYYIKGGKKCKSSDIRCDNSPEEAVKVEGGARYHTFVDFTCSNGGYGMNNTYNALDIGGSANNNIFSDFLFVNDKKDEVWRYCVYEDDRCGNNSINNMLVVLSDGNIPYGTDLYSVYSTRTHVTDSTLCDDNWINRGNVTVLNATQSVTFAHGLLRCCRQDVTPTWVYVSGDDHLQTGGLVCSMKNVTHITVECMIPQSENHNINWLVWYDPWT